MDTLRFTVLPDDDGITMGTFLRKRCGLSARVVNSLKQQPDGMLADGERLWTIHRLNAGQTITVTLPDDRVSIEGVAMSLDIVYEDEHLLVINKPPYLAVHPSAGKPEPTLANGVVAYFAANGTPRSFRPTNRLDRNTSGLLLAAKHQPAAFALNGCVQKTYRAIALGCLNGSGTIDAPLRVKEGCAITREVGTGGKPSVTHWESLGSDGEITELKIVLETGRTHQIRAHFSWLSHPLVGDTMYGPEGGEMARHALHCEQMTIRHPFTGETVSLSAPLPDDMQDCLARHSLRK